MRPVLENADLQKRSPFFTRLPVEVRSLVYYFVFPFQIVHVKENKGRLVGTVCRESPGELFCRCICTLFGTCGSLTVLGLPLTCRMAYAETIPVLYNQNSLCFVYISQWQKFFNNVLQNQQFTLGALQSLRSLQLNQRISGRRTFNSYDEAALIASLRLISEQASCLKHLSIDIPGGTKHKSELLPLSLKIVEALGQLRGLHILEFDSQHPLYALRSMSSHGLEIRTRYEDRTASLEKMLQKFVYLPKSSLVSPFEVDKALATEYHQIIHG